MNIQMLNPKGPSSLRSKLPQVPTPTAPSEPAGDSVTLNGPLESRLSRSARRPQKDALLAVAGITTSLLPGMAGYGLGLGVGGMAILSGMGELATGVSKGDSRQAFDGALHVFSGALVGATALCDGSGYSPYLAGLNTALLLAKVCLNHPAEATKAVVSESAYLAVDAAASSAHLARAAWRQIS